MRAVKPLVAALPTEEMLSLGLISSPTSVGLPHLLVGGSNPGGDLKSVEFEKVISGLMTDGAADTTDQGGVAAEQSSGISSGKSSVTISKTGGGTLTPVGEGILTPRKEVEVRFSGVPEVRRPV